MELLVVLAIVGVLASIAIVSLNNARSKANDAETVAQLSMARTSAQIFYEEHESYNGEAGNVARKCDEKKSMFLDYISGMFQYTTSSNYPDGTDLRCSSNDQAYEITASLNNSREFWCVNSQGLSKKITAQNHTKAHPNNDIDCTP